MNSFRTERLAVLPPGPSLPPTRAVVVVITYVYTKSEKAYLDDDCILTASSTPMSISLSLFLPYPFPSTSVNPYSPGVLAFRVDVPGPSQPPYWGLFRSSVLLCIMAVTSIQFDARELTLP